MNPFLSILSFDQFIETIKGYPSWIGLVLLISVVLFLSWISRKLNPIFTRKQRLTGAILLLSVPLTSLFLGILLPAGQALHRPGLAEDPIRPLILLFSSIPWMLAAGMLGPVPAAFLAFFSGLLRAYWHTHLWFTPLQTAILALVLGICLRQNYRTQVFRWLRYPIVAILPVMLWFTLLHVLVTPLTVSGTLVNRVDYALSTLPGFFTAQLVELMIAALIGEGVRRAAPKHWRQSKNLVPSPSERSLQTRFLINLSPLALILIITMMAGTWYQAERSARRMLEQRMENSAQVAAEQLPLFVRTGQSLVTLISQDPRLVTDDRKIILTALAEDIKIIPYFTHLVLFNTQGDLLAQYPESVPLVPDLVPEELIAKQLALTANYPFSSFAIPPEEGQTASQVSFIASIKQDDQTIRVILARTDLALNPLSAPIISSLKNLEGEDGQSILLDEQNRILVHPDPDQMMEIYQSPELDKPDFSEHTSSTGTRQFVYYYPVPGLPWKIVLTAPASRTQQIAVEIAGPLLVIIVILSILAALITRFALRVVTSSVKTLAVQSGRIAQGHLDHPLIVDGEDEISQLRRAFEQMRVSLKARLDELNRLLIISKGVASSLEISEAIQPILESALVSGASISRVVLLPAVVPELDDSGTTPISLSQGIARQAYHELDDQILGLTRQNDRIILSDIRRPRLIQFNPHLPHPKSLATIALRHENKYFGAFWVGYNEPHTFSKEEVQFLATLASHAALAAANARLFLNAEVGRQRLAAILASSPDPILVIDQHDCLLLSNPAAWQVLGMNIELNEGKPIDQVIHHAELIDLLRTSVENRQSKEIALPDQRVFLATATAVLAEGQRVGRVCVLRDITNFKQLDSLKTDFVATVSHDLRSPLTLIRGYATMLDGLGQLNEQQTDYVKKIVSAVEDMTRLVNNLLDLGRIDAGVGLQLELVSAEEIIDHVVTPLRMQAAQKRIQLTTEFPEQPVPLIEADRALLQQALQNLVDNAIKYTRVEGKVNLRVDIRNIGVVFEVQDNGAGISPMDLPRLFERFYRGGQQGVRDQRGTGLGLAIVKSIAEKHGGRIWADSQLGKGSIFYLSIPLRQPKSMNET